MTTGIPASIVTIVVGLIFIAAKAASPGTKDLNNAIDLIERLTGQLRGIAAQRPEMRSAALPPDVAFEEMPERPNKFARMFWG
jgi:hypothetical protein